MPLPCDISRQTAPEPAAVLEALLFLSGKPMKLADICEHTGWTAAEAETAADGLSAILDGGRGLMLLRVAGGYQLVTRPELYEQVRWVHTGTTELSPMAMEVLAIVAFKQPVTRADIEKLRGVSSERILASLIQQGLVVDLGRKESPGRPIIYGTSPYFLECIGMDSLADLAGHIPPEIQNAGSAGTTETGAEEETWEDTDGTVTEGHE